MIILENPARVLLISRCDSDGLPTSAPRTSATPLSPMGLCEMTSERSIGRPARPLAIIDAPTDVMSLPSRLRLARKAHLLTKTLMDWQLRSVSPRYDSSSECSGAFGKEWFSVSSSGTTPKSPRLRAVPSAALGALPLATTLGEP